MKKNPALALNRFLHSFGSTDNRVMTLEGVIQKTALLLACVCMGAGISWYLFSLKMFSGLLALGSVAGVAGFILGLVTTSIPSKAYITAPLYSLCQGIAVGSMSIMLNAQVSGLAISALYTTTAIFTALLLGYRLGFIKVTNTFRGILVGSCIGILAITVVESLLSFVFSYNSLIHSTGLLGILFTCFTIVIASMSLVANFEDVYQACQYNVAKNAEWYAGFGLVLSILWVYIEVMRLLFKYARRK